MGEKDDQSIKDTLCVIDEGDTEPGSPYTCLCATRKDKWRS